ncbi:sodium-dependent phosphate transport protein 2A-like isoform X2 [Homarus americanus]|uniref:sodium-dependent phosphate transport protein 2A-like isoform X2 n=1 Tax=Homarus americanus TaxID=6706 RepID=UPI001C445E87|nr:sodium-dependent phosphate transport protein 2A-like isoform X2 [Homarus americanus]
MVKKAGSKLVKKSKKHGIPRDELVTVKSDLILLAPEFEDIEEKRLEGSTWSRPNQRDPEDPHKEAAAGKGGVGARKAGVRAGVVCLKLVSLVTLLYLFICSLKLLASSFRLLGGRTASAVFQQSQLLSNPVVGLMMGVLVTVLVQSSSTSSSIIVSMVSANFLDVPTAIPIIMGANIGTSVTNTLVSIGQIGDREQFERAFAGAVVHDMFNWLCVMVLLPLEVTTGYLDHLTTAILSSVTLEHNNMKVELLSSITKPFTDKIITLDKSVLTGWTMKDPAYENATLLQRLCPHPHNASQYVTCQTVAAHLPLSDTGVGLVLLAASLLLLTICLIAIVKTLSSMLKGSVAGMVQHVLNANLPRVPWLTGYLAIIAGAIITFVLQSSSIFTSTLTPLVGLGMISVERVYPLTLGSNLGTTTTALLAALASDSASLRPAIQIALVHLFFNVTGLLMWYPIPFMRLPVRMALALGRITSKYRWFAAVYMVMTFCIVPLFVFVVSLGGAVVMYSVFIPLAVFILIVAFINLAQVHFPKCLPSLLRTWHWLPLPLRSLQPYDDLITRLMCCSRGPGHEYAHVPAVSVQPPLAGVEQGEGLVVVVEEEAEKEGEGGPGEGANGQMEVQIHSANVTPRVVFVQHETST